MDSIFYAISAVWLVLATGVIYVRLSMPSKPWPIVLSELRPKHPDEE